jgi:hypothetical protein
MTYKKDWGGNDIVPTKKKRKCPRCGCMHNHPTEDKLCEKCEIEWVAEYEQRLDVNGE